MRLNTIVSTTDIEDDAQASFSSIPENSSIPSLHGDESDDDDDNDNITSHHHKGKKGKGSSSTTADEDDEPAAPAIAVKEAQAVFATKFLVACVLLLSAALLGYASFWYARNEEEHEFQTKFLDYADEIARSGVNNAKNSFTVLQSFSRTVTSLVNYANDTWPLLSLPDFEVRANDYKSISGVEQLAFAPIVTDRYREAWEDYTKYNQQWIQQGLDYEYLITVQEQANDEDEDDYLTKDLEEEPIAPGTNMEGFSIINKAKPIQEFIWKHAPLTHRAIPETNKGPHVPIWQTYPAPRNSYVVNHNLRSVPEFENLITTSISQQMAVLSDVVDNFALFGNSKNVDLDPKSVVVQPIFDDVIPFKNRRSTDNGGINGFLVVIKKWHSHFQDVLYVGAEPVICVLRNSCGKAFTYEIHGPRATFLGEGDLHDTTYDDMVVIASFSDQYVASACEYTVEVYPTQEMEQAYNTAMPIYVSLVVICVFGFTTLVFLLYDFFVSKRQETVMASAQATNRIVSNLFPRAVRERLIQEMEVQDAKDADSITGNSTGGITSLSRGSGHGSKPGVKKTLRRRLSSVTLRASVSAFQNTDCNQSVASVGTSKSSKKGKGGGSAAADKKNTFGTSEDIFGSKPIAELFPETTIMFADMVGFTAWASVREPTQVFTLLETCYHAFDSIAKRRKVFKVETIGDCYVAVAGLPQPRKDHAVVMSRFSSECLAQMDMLTKNLEASLGPDTGDLSLRIGLHSGQVTAGVLRGEKGRFQLFGDTMNTASRMESTGQRARIQISKETAALLRSDGKDRWVTERDEKIHAKGKGLLQTFWLQIKTTTSDDNDSNSEIASLMSEPTFDDDLEDAKKEGRRDSAFFTDAASEAKFKRLIEWNSEILGKLLKQIVLRRISRNKKKKQLGKLNAAPMDSSFETRAPTGSAINEVKDIISLPHFDPKNFAKNVDPNSVEIPEQVSGQLFVYVSCIADLYRNGNPFHGFEHASHVTMSVTKLMSRIVNPLQVDGHTSEQNKILHDHTFGITSDPLTQFACVLSALIHDADHPGVSNTVLVTEKDPLATKYHDKSVAEQNSVDLAWNILMEERFEELRSYIYTNEDEFRRFRQIIVNMVLATDIMDKELGAQRKARWEKAFNDDTNSLHSSVHSGSHMRKDFDGTLSHIELNQFDDVNRKATIVLEHLIQASDVSHTMQHWHVFVKWNERLFREVYQAYVDGRIEKNPADGWYKGEIGFFDFYIIPLAKKLATCGVFGVSSDEYLGYAEANRREWEEKGEQIVKDYLKRYEADYLG